MAINCQQAVQNVLTTYERRVKAWITHFSLLFSKTSMYVYLYPENV